MAGRLELKTFPQHENHLIHRIQEVYGVQVENWFRREISNTMYGAAKTMLKGCQKKLERAEAKIEHIREDRDKWKDACLQEIELNSMLTARLTNNPIVPPMHV